MYNGWGSIYWDSSVGDTAAWGLHLQSPPNVGVADQPLVDEFTTNYIVGGEALCLAPNFDNYTSEMGAISGITSPSNGSAEFNGTSDYIDIPDTNLPSGTSARTISVWIYPNANDNGRILSYGTGSANAAFDIITQASTNVLAVIGYATNYFSTTTISTDEWTFVSITLSSNTLKMYVNGSEVYSTGSASINTTLSGSARIGKGVWDVNDWNGNLANVAIWNRALTSDEINSVMWKGYDSLTASEQNGLQAWYALDNITGTDVPDSTGNYNGTAY